MTLSTYRNISLKKQTVLFCACDTTNFFIVRIQIIIHRWRKKEKKNSNTHSPIGRWLLFCWSFFRENFTYIKLFHDAVYHIICHVWFWMWRIFNKKHFTDATAENKRMGTGKKNSEILMLHKENWLPNQNAKEAKQRWNTHTHAGGFTTKKKRRSANPWMISMKVFIINRRRKKNRKKSIEWKKKFWILSKAFVVSTCVDYNIHVYRILFSCAYSSIAMVG